MVTFARPARARHPETSEVRHTLPPRFANLAVLLELADVTYFQYRGRAYALPLLSFRSGQRLMALRLRLATAAGEGPMNSARQAEYFAAMAEIARLCWRLCRPVYGRFLTPLIMRMLKRVRLLRNPFLGASEAEVVELADFFLRRRMRQVAGVVASRRVLSIS